MTHSDASEEHIEMHPAQWAPVPIGVRAIATACATAGPGFVAGATRKYLGVVAVTLGKRLWRLTRLLRWCHDRGLLMSAGTVYQVRHGELLEWLQR